MEAEYYIPKEEDLFLGYEAQVYESFPQYNERNIVTHYEWEWHHTVLDSGYKLNYWRNQLKDEHLRTPFITAEQIEAEGWKEEGGLAHRSFIKGGHSLSIDYFLHRIWIYNAKEDLCLFNGICPSVNEFRKICGLLNIKNEDTKTAEASDGETTGEK